MLLRNLRTGKQLAEKVEVADSFWLRLKGLMFRREMDDGEAMLFKFGEMRKFRVHTFFVFFPIDLIFLDRNFKVVEVETNLSPWSIYNPSNESRYLLELPKNKAEGVREGDLIRPKPDF